MHEIGAVKFGSFTLKSGIESPFYLDLRKVISHPQLNSLMCSLLAGSAAKLDFDCVLGIPYTALPAAAYIAEKLQKPLFMLRKEEKKYGAGGRIVGDPEKIGRCLIVDDLVTTGGSKFETADSLKAEGFKVADILVAVDRSAGAVAELGRRGLRLHSLVSLDEVVSLLLEDGSLETDKARQIKAFTEALPAQTKTAEKRNNAPAVNPFTVKLKAVMDRKKTNLILSLDTEDRDEFFEILGKTADSIAMVKTHVDIIRDFTPDFIESLRRLADEKDFLIFEDRKFADIGNTVMHQFYGGIFRIADWADCVTSHLIAGEGTLKGLFPEEGVYGSDRPSKPQAAFLLARMSTKGNLITEDYSKRVMEAGTVYSSVVSGYIGHGTGVEDISRYKSMIPEQQMLLMPGVKLERGKDNMGQQYLTVEEAMDGGADCIIVGRGIIKAADPAETAEVYRERAWNRYSKK